MGIANVGHDRKRRHTQTGGLYELHSDFKVLCVVLAGNDNASGLRFLPGGTKQSQRQTGACAREARAAPVASGEPAAAHNDEAVGGWGRCQTDDAIESGI